MIYHRSLLDYRLYTLHYQRVKVRYTFRIYPNEPQRIKLACCFGVSRYAFNWGLRWWSDSFRAGEKPNYHKCSAAWTKERNSHTWTKEVSCTPPQQALRYLQRAMVNFFEKRSSFPRFKSKRSKQSASFTGSGFKYNTNVKSLTISKIGSLKVIWTRELPSSPTTVTITKSPSGKYFATLCLEVPDPIPLPKTGKSVGIDLGINRLATLSTGEGVPNPRYLAKNLAKLARAQKDLARKQKGSKRRNRQRIKVARLHEHIANCRKDAMDKLTLRIVKEFDDICIEDLNVRGMGRNRSLAKSLSDASFGMARQLLDYKARWYGKRLWVIDRFYPSSKTCSSCGWIAEKLPLDIREWACPECGATHDRDVNAAKNILAVGHTVKGRGLGVRPKQASA